MVVFYRAMHYSAKRGLAIACRLSVCPFVCLTVSVTLVDQVQMWDGMKFASLKVS